MTLYVLSNLQRRSLTYLKSLSQVYSGSYVSNLQDPSITRYESSSSIPRAVSNIVQIMKICFVTVCFIIDDDNFKIVVG